MASKRQSLWSALASACAVIVLAVGTPPTALAQGDGDGQSGGQPGYNGAPTVVSGGGVPTMNGVPCVGGHLGTCTAFAQNQPPRKTPRAIVGHSPTVRGG